MRGSRLCLLLALALAATGLQAKVYKWVDDQGQVHYGAQPPAREQAQEMKVRSAPPAPQAAENDPAKQPPPEGEDQARQRDPALEKNCEMARSNLAVLQDPANRRFRTEDGAVTYFTDEQRQARIEQARQYLEDFCE